MSVRKKEAEAITEKKVQVMNVQRKVVEKNIAPHSARYRIDKHKKMSIGKRSSRTTANQPCKRPVSMSRPGIARLTVNNHGINSYI